MSMSTEKDYNSSFLAEDNFAQIKNLQQYLSDQNKILNHKVVQSPMRKHNKITKLIKQARVLGLLSFTTKYD